MRNKPEDFISQRAVVAQKEDWYGFTCLEVLPELCGCPWNEITMCYVMALKPSCIRVVDGTATADANSGRITVFLENNLIHSISWEVSIPVPDGMSGFDTKCALYKMKELR